ncbi:MAG: twin-arginine translocase subunit TatC [Zetaproteobacteria bacterium]|nr:twin-arginine translocase subunit TatC [Pseudobdellovibrionaceae bacterium]
MSEKTHQIEGDEYEDNHDPKVMGLMDHLDEMRSRIVKSILAILALFVTTFGFANEVLLFLSKPLLAITPEGANPLHFTGPLEVFVAQIKVSFLTAVVASCPIWFYQFWRFIEPALYENERKYILPFAFASASLFLGGVGFCFFIMLPMALEFLMGLGPQAGIVSILTVSEYISFLMILILGFGLIFETPVVLVLLAMLDLITAEGLSRNRKIILVGILTVGAIITPPDPLSQIMMAVPTYLMFELSILFIKMIQKGNKETMPQVTK